MYVFSEIASLILAVVGVSALLAMGHALACQCRNATAQHQLRLEVRELQHAYTQQLIELTTPKTRRYVKNPANANLDEPDDEPITVDVLDENGNVETEAAPPEPIPVGEAPPAQATPEAAAEEPALAAA
ncbi:MAG: hypothetical protein AAGI17_09095 [Planctomycetota bacterium]